MAAAESEALTANLNKTAAAGAAGAAGVAAGATTGEETPTEGDGTAAESRPGAPEVDDFAALAGSGKGSSKAADEKKPAAKKSKSTSDDESEEDAEDAEDEDEPKTRPAAVEEEGGFPFGLIIPIITALLIVTVVLLKVFGIGGKKTEE